MKLTALRLRAGLGAVALVTAAAGSAVWSVRPRGGEADRLFQGTRAALDAGRVDEAARAVGRLARLRAPTPFDRLLRARVADAQGRPGEAVAELDRVEAAHPLAPVARLLAGRIELGRGRLPSAEAHLRVAVAMEPGADQARKDLVYLYNLQHRQAELDGQFLELSRRGALNYDYLLHWGKTRNVVWNPARDCEALAKAVAADPADRASRLALSEGLRRMNRLDEAEAALAPLPPDDPEARAGRSRIALDRGDAAGLERLLAGAPEDDGRLASVRGHLALSRRDSASAVRHFRVALAADPDDRAALSALGSALRAAGDPGAAEPYLAAARRHDALTPLISRASTAAGANDPKTPGLLGAACEAAGRLPEALAWYRLAAARDPLDREAQAALGRLARRVAARGASAGTGRDG